MANWTAIKVADIRAMYPELTQSAVDSNVIERSITRAERILKSMVRRVWGVSATVAADETVLEWAIMLTAAFVYMTVYGQRAFGSAEGAIRTSRHLVDLVEKWVADTAKSGELSVARKTALRVTSTANRTAPIHHMGESYERSMPTTSEDGVIDPPERRF